MRTALIVAALVSSAVPAHATKLGLKAKVLFTPKQTRARLTKSAIENKVPAHLVKQRVDQAMIQLKEGKYTVIQSAEHFIKTGDEGKANTFEYYYGDRSGF